jgi:hypothetical protein
MSDKMPTKNNYFQTFFASYFLKVRTFTSVLKDKSLKKSQNSRNQGFSYFLYLLMEGSGSGSIQMMDLDPGGPKTYCTDPAGSV